MKTSLGGYGFVLAASMLLASLLGASCAPDPTKLAFDGLYERDVSAGLFDTAPVRGTRGPLQLHFEGETLKCSECHPEGFTGEFNELALEGAHQGIVFQHGPNKLCLNCHNPQHADAYVGYGTELIPGDQPSDLCKKCHGPHHREWLIGVHGRMMNTWKRDDAATQRLDCIQCHDPHHPDFAPMRPLPPPVHTRFDLVQNRDDHDGTRI